MNKSKPKDRKYRPVSILKHVTRLIPALMLLFAVWTISVDPVYANWHDVKLKPGETYDCSKAGKNTTVTIDQPGEYSIKGKSRYVRVIVESGGVDLYLEDGLDLNCSLYTFIGSRTAAINIWEQGGTVRLISRKNAKIYLEGYMAPAIRKDESKTKLIFETEDPNNPGCIEAIGGSFGPGIGSVMHVGSNVHPPCGNITINSGEIVAKGKNGSAGIGGGQMTHADNITINGGDVYAEGSTDGAGIGGGYFGSGQNIFITGGKVYAQTANDYETGAAAIGGGGGASGGYSDMEGNNIFISGGDVTAIAYGVGTAIGGGKESSGKNIVISGGKVHAEVKTASKGKRPGNIPAIGGGGGNNVADCDVKITGGEVYAKGGWGAPGIGSKGTKIDLAKVNVVISGGTVTVEHGPHESAFSDYDIGGYDEDKVDIRITGGSVYAAKLQKPKNENGELLHRVDVSFDGHDKDGIAVSDASFADGLKYGMNDVYTNHGGKIYPWLPETGTDQLRKAKLGGAWYGGSIAVSDTLGTLYRASVVTLHPNTGEPGFSNGSGIAFMYDTKLSAIKEPVIPAGFSISGYEVFTDSGSKKIAETDGALFPNVSGFTDENGRWISTETTVTFNAVVQPIHYSLRFEANRPAWASTKVSGSMEGVDVQYSATHSTTLPANGFALPGYRFVSWNTKADGSGTSFEDAAAIKNDLSTKDGDSVKLYAQWAPKQYQIILDSGEGGFGTANQSMTFDQYDVLKKVSALGWSNQYKGFHCWKDEDGNMYEDGDDVVDLVKTNADGTPKTDGNGNLIGKTLTAQWVNHGIIAVTVTNDGRPEAGHEDHFKLINKDDPNIYFEPAFAYADGIYTFKSPDDEQDPSYIPFGAYYLSFDAEDNHAVSKEMIQYAAGRTANVVFDYHTVSLEADTSTVGIENVVMSVGEGGLPVPITDNTAFAPDGAMLTIRTNLKDGYHFDGYSACGIAPEWDPQKQTQTVAVRGGAELMAHAEANAYTVHFDGNNGGIVSGEMEDQDMVYGEAQHLFANQFKCTGGTFTGWNTEKDGSGRSFTDRQNVSNLTTENGGRLTLYAQWDMQEYGISYDLAGGELWGGAVNPYKYTAADTFTLNDPEKEEHDFTGWIGTGCPVLSTKVTIPQGSTGDREYTACWRLKSYVISFELNGGTGEEKAYVYIHHKLQKPEDPVREHYTFAGWYADKELTKPYDFNTEITEEKTLYAKWDNITHTITYDLNGGSLNGKKGTVEVVANEGDTIRILDAPVREGYIFKYWKGSKYYPGDEFVVAEDHTLTAQWVRKDRSGGPGTGDDSGLAIWIITMAASAAAITVIAVRRLRRR